MKKKRGILFLLAAALCLGALTACAGPASDGSVPKGASGKRLGGNQLIGIALPDESDGRWVRDAEVMKADLEGKGYLVEVAYAEGDGKTQQEQVKALLDDDCNVVIVAAVEPSSLAAAMDGMGVEDATIISYHGMVADCPAIRYSLALDGYANGRGQARYLIKKLKLDKRSKKNPAHLEIFHLAGSASGAYALQGAMEVLKPYIQKKVLTVPSGQTKAENCGVADPAAAAERVKRLMEEQYAQGESLDAVLCTDDGVSLWLAKGLEDHYTGSVYPLVAGCNGTCESIGMTLSGRQVMTTVENGADMPVRAAKMAEQVLNGEEVSLTQPGEGNPCDQPAWLYQPMGVTAGNAQERIFQSKLYVQKKNGTVTVPGQEKAEQKKDAKAQKKDAKAQKKDAKARKKHAKAQKKDAKAQKKDAKAQKKDAKAQKNDKEQKKEADKS